MARSKGAASRAMSGAWAVAIRAAMARSVRGARAAASRESWPGATTTVGKELLHLAYRPTREPCLGDEECDGRTTTFRLAGDLAAGELPAPFLRDHAKGPIAFFGK